VTGSETLELHLARYEFAALHAKRGRLLDMACGAGYGTRAVADRLPDLYAYQDFWRTSPAWFAMRLGIVVALGGLLQLLPDLLERPLAWLTLLGRQSLVGYIASVQLTYGALGKPLEKRLSFEATLLAIVAMAVVTWAISVAWERLQASRRARRAATG
jgi:hypothetical protein